MVEFVISRCWELVEDLGEESLFLGDNQSICVKAFEYPGCKANHIYFTDDWCDIWEDRGFGKDKGVRSITVDTTLINIIYFLLFIFKKILNFFLSLNNHYTTLTLKKNFFILKQSLHNTVIIQSLKI